MLRTWRLITVLLLSAGAVANAQTWTYTDLVHRLTDLEQLSVLPKPGEKCAQFSSYDRASRFDASTGKYVGWDANGDHNGILRTENGQQVLAEMNGPGVIWRIWSAAPGKGHVRIYLDGAAEPQVDLPFTGYFDGKNAPFVYPALVHDASSGKNCYVPIPFGKSCKITADPDWGAYYHFTYTTYPDSVTVPTFTRTLTEAETAALAAADKTLSVGLGSDPAGPRKGQSVIRRTLTIKPGEAVDVARIRGPRAITALHVALAFADRKDEILGLRELTVQITFDGDEKPAVWTPLGDFFGTAPGINKYRSLPLGMTDAGLYSFWYMPFGRSATVTIANDGKSLRKLRTEIAHARLTRPIAELGRFHAKWHRDAFLPEEPERNIDWTMLTTEGIGRFVGVNLHIWNPRGGWWGEGDELFHVDGEVFPSTFGTGSEDYFGYAWCNPARFENAYHNQPFNDGNNRGNVSVNRWHITDNGPFRKSWTGYIEKYYPNSMPSLHTATAYWYLAPGGVDPYSPATLDDRIGYFKTDPPQQFAIKGAIEGETMKVLSKTAGVTQSQDLSAFGATWSKDAQVWWTEAKVGDKLTLALPVTKAGRYSVKVGLTKAIDYAIVQLSIDGRAVGSPFDAFNDTVVPSGEIDLGVMDLAAGDRELTVEITGSNPKAVASFMFGLDYVKLEPAK